jgi:hypothetical protein
MPGPDHDRYLVCVRRDAPGKVDLWAVQRLCSRCGVMVWVAPSGIALIAKHGLAIICTVCADAIEPGVARLPITPEDVSDGMATILHYRRRKPG